MSGIHALVPSQASGRVDVRALSFLQDRQTYVSITFGHLVVKLNRGLSGLNSDSRFPVKQPINDVAEISKFG